MQGAINNIRHYTSFNIVFEDDRFKGSTLQGMGITLSENQWAISSGTGEFALAHEQACLVSIISMQLRSDYNSYL
ncbi:hypothetical protein C2845_PM03G29690 [Panicum miliaceum]|uniref:Dirigent protein n=1 Tax=Panicum miliaceum TaxID=4540 RepID=A0A3L6T9A8_PANMI|nr:hypothetical protein C2845_PM03G29690 [Panicum miliaceum]